MSCFGCLESEIKRATALRNFETNPLSHSSEATAWCACTPQSNQSWACHVRSLPSALHAYIDIYVYIYIYLHWELGPHVAPCWTIHTFSEAIPLLSRFQLGAQPNSGPVPATERPKLLSKERNCGKICTNQDPNSPDSAFWPPKRQSCWGARRTTSSGSCWAPGWDIFGIAPTPDRAVETSTSRTTRASLQLFSPPMGISKRRPFITWQGFLQDLYQNPNATPPCQQ